MHRFIFFILVIFLTSCQSDGENNYVWFYQLPDAGTNSSPHVIDLTGDGIGDIVIGSGRNEHQKTPHAVLAINGETGEELWRVGGNDQMVGSAIFQDINADNIPDVFISGRKSMLFAIDGKNGNIIWEYDVDDPKGNSKNAIFNFYNPQFIPDINADGIKDILVSNGGNVYASPTDSIPRLPGVLMVLDGRNGNVIAADVMPDGRETYMAPIFYQEGENLFIIFGSGGETFGGALYKATLNQLLTHKLENANVLLKRKGHGFIAPPVIADINQDNIKDIVVNWHGGEVIAIDGSNDHTIWQHTFEGTEANASPIPGYFNGDEILDFFSSFQNGKWPQNFASIHWMINGKTGKVEYLDTLGCTGFASSVSVDLNKDQYDEVILSYNDFNCYSISKENIVNQLVAIDFHTGTKKSITSERGKNISSTPWVGDLDNDKLIDLLFVVQVNQISLLEFNGFGIGRIELDQTLDEPPTWNAYLGNNYNGVFEK